VIGRREAALLLAELAIDLDRADARSDNQEASARFPVFKTLSNLGLEAWAGALFTCSRAAGQNVPGSARSGPTSSSPPTRGTIIATTRWAATRN
jgi:hypothetical protein